MGVVDLQTVVSGLVVRLRFPPGDRQSMKPVCGLSHGESPPDLWFWFVALFCHLAVCWTFRELGPGSVNVLSLLLDLRHGTRYPSTSELLHPWSLLNGCSRHNCLKYRFSYSLHDITFLAFLAS